MAARNVIALAGLLVVTGCAEAGSAVNSVTTAGFAAAVGSVTGSPILGLVAGIAASFGVDQGVKYAERRLQGNVQTAIARAAGPLDVGQAASWEVAEKVPLTDRAGTVEVARVFGEAIPCKDVVFIVGDGPELYVTTICQAKDGAWQWALAEPTVTRWGDLQ